MEECPFFTADGAPIGPGLVAYYCEFGIFYETVISAIVYGEVFECGRHILPSTLYVSLAACETANNFHATLPSYAMPWAQHLVAGARAPRGSRLVRHAGRYALECRRMVELLPDAAPAGRAALVAWLWQELQQAAARMNLLLRGRPRGIHQQA